MNRLGLVANGLCYGNHPDAMLGKLAEIEFLFKGLAEKPAITVHKNDIERVLTVAGAFNHLLEAWSAVVAGRRASFDVLGHNLVAVRAAPRFQLAALVGNRQVVLRLPTGRNAHVERCTHGRTSVVGGTNRQSMLIVHW